MFVTLVLKRMFRGGRSVDGEILNRRTVMTGLGKSIVGHQVCA